MARRKSSRGSDGKWLLAGAFMFVLIGRNILKKFSEADLQGQVALVTGASRGLGFLIARELSREGCRVAICARDVDELRWAQEELQKAGAEVLPLQCDVADRNDVDRMISDATAHFGRIDILVNNAGIIQFGPLKQMTHQDYENAIAIMYMGKVYATLAVLPQMRRRQAGRIINITSIGGLVTAPHLVPYSGAKYAAVGFSRGLRAELSKENISVTTIVPGLMRTGSFKHAIFKGKHEDEFTWFKLGSSLPGISMDAERAAKQIVQATKRGEAERILSVPATILAKFNGLFPGITANLMAATDRFLLPDSNDGSQEAMEGKMADQKIDSRLLDAVTVLGESAAHRFQPDMNRKD